MRDTPRHPLLFHHFPGLEDKLDWIELGDFPTPVRKLEHLGIDNLWIKNDGLSSSVYGGNKVRKLEFILAAVKNRNAGHVITFGGLGTNHGLATAIFCKRLGLDCTLLLFKQPVTRHVKTNMLLFQQYGAKVIFHQSLFGAVLSYHTIQRIKHPGAYFLFSGGSNPIGTIGFVNAAFELKAQIEAGALPEPAVIFCPAGSTGTLAGLSLGVALAGLRSQVIGVRVSVSHVGPFQACTRKATWKLMRQTWHYLKSRCHQTPPVEIAMPTLPALIEDYLGAGYGHPTAAGRKAHNLLKDKEGILLDPCYTSKTFAAVMDHCRVAGKEKDAVLYWHTYNSVDLSAQAASIDYHALPPSLHPFFEKKEIGF